MKAIFSKKLYWEGFKKIKVVGIAFTAISAILCALIPFIQILDWYATDPLYREPSVVEPMFFALPVLFILMLASPIIVLNMFSFLNKRSESDFYHAIPFKRSCVYISFMAAVLSWLTLISLLSIGAAAIFWTIHPGATFAASLPFILLGICLLLAAMLSAITVVAMTLTGTIISNLLIACLMLAFIRAVGALFTVALGEVIPLLYIPLTPARFLELEYSLPIAIFEALMTPTVLFNNASMIIYTLIVTLLLLVAGCFIYMFRKSEMATKSAPNKWLQHLYRCAIALPFALLSTMCVYLGEDFSFFIVCAVITIIIYYLYELITTKRFKNLAKATPFLAVLVAGGLIFVGASELTKSVTLSYTPSAEDLTKISLISNSESSLYYGMPTYESLKTKGISLDDPEALKIVADGLSDSVERIKNDTYYDYGGYYGSESYTFRTIQLTDKSGKVCGRKIRLTDENSSRLDALFLNSEPYSQAIMQMPADSEIQSIYFNNMYSEAVTEAQKKQLWHLLTEEFNQLSNEEKLNYKSVANSPYFDSESNTILTYVEVYGSIGTQSFRSIYPLRTDLFPQTAALYTSVYNQLENHSLADLKEIIPLIESDRLGYVSIAIDNIDGFYIDYDEEYASYPNEIKTKLREMMDYIAENSTTPENGANYIQLSMYIGIYTDNERYYSYSENSTIVNLTDSALETLRSKIEEINELMYGQKYFD